MTFSSRSLRPSWPRLVAAALLACGSACLSGCSGSLIGETLPAAVGGLPAEAPTKSETPTAAYPAVHNMPPARGNTPPLSADQQKQLEDDLVAARNRYGSNPDAPPDTGKSDTGKTANAKAGGAPNP
jgi:hypothetical protein